MNNNFNPLKEKNVLNLYADFLKNIGIELSILKDSDFEKEIELIQIKLSDEMLLNLLFLPLEEQYLKTISILQFHLILHRPTINELENLKLVNALNLKIPIGKFSLDSQNNFDYRYHMTLSSLVLLNQQEFIDRFYLVLIQLDAFFSILPLSADLDVLLEKIEKL